jgi:hypothetical protein
MSEHNHTWAAWQVKPIKRIDNKDYQGHAGDMAFLVQQCKECPKVEARDYGQAEAMREKLERVAGAV